ncbi:MAG: ABC transporter ATP-binding protein [Acidimicrobiia bacterium]|nr:MAG: ABC transporter ATP-binding protein [Acidimicrobiia bacterium]
MSASRPPLLRVAELTAGYGPVQVLHGIDFTVDEGEVVVILGANGAGQDDDAARPLGHRRGARRDRVRGAVAARDQAGEGGARRDRRTSPRGSGTLTELTVEENLRLGAYARRDPEIAADVERWYEVFPRLAERRDQQAGSMSGGEQQMLAIARALMSRPRLVLLDEPSLGLAPIVTQELFRVLADLNRERGLSMLVVEQNAGLALGIATRGYVLEAGSIAVSGTAAELATDDDVRKAYLGI